MNANHGPTAIGSLKVQQMIQGTFVSGSDTMFQSAPLPLKGVYYTCAPCYLVGIEKKYTSITYTQKHGLKCLNLPTFIDWLGDHPELHHLIPQCIVIDEFEREDATTQANEDESFSVSHLHYLQASFNSKVIEMKKAADLLAEYTREVTQSSPSSKDINDIPTPPPPAPPALLPAPPANLAADCPKRSRKPSVKALEAEQSI